MSAADLKTKVYQALAEQFTDDPLVDTPDALRRIGQVDPELILKMIFGEDHVDIHHVGTGRIAWFVDTPMPKAYREGK